MPAASGGANSPVQGDEYHDRQHSGHTGNIEVELRARKQFRQRAASGKRSYARSAPRRHVASGTRAGLRAATERGAQGVSAMRRSGERRGTPPMAIRIADAKLSEHGEWVGSIHVSGDILERSLESPQLPTLLAAAIRVVALAHRSDVEIDEVVATIGSDPAPRSRILRTANSSYYGRSGAVPNHCDAEALVAAADCARYEAERTGRNRVHAVDPVAGAVTHAGRER